MLQKTQEERLNKYPYVYKGNGIKEYHIPMKLKEKKEINKGTKI